MGKRHDKEWMFALARVVSQQPKNNTPVELSVQPDKLVPAVETSATLPFYESTLLWGALSAVIALVSVYLGFSLKDIRWFLAIAWPFCILVVVSLAKTIRKTRHEHGMRLSIILMGSALCGLGLWQLARTFPPPNNQDVGQQIENALGRWHPNSQISATSQQPSTPGNENVLPKADLIAAFVEPEDLELVISNESQMTAHQPTFQTLFVNLNAPVAAILPIGRQTGDFLRGHTSLLEIPILHYGNTLALNGLKQGDRIFGWLFLSCADCKMVRYYYVYYEYQKGGWYAETTAEPSPEKFHSDYDALAQGTMSFDSYVKPDKRIPIAAHKEGVPFPEQGTLR